MSSWPRLTVACRWHLNTLQFTVVREDIRRASSPYSVYFARKNIASVLAVFRQQGSAICKPEPNSALRQDCAHHRSTLGAQYYSSSRNLDIRQLRFRCLWSIIPSLRHETHLFTSTFIMAVYVAAIHVQLTHETNATQYEQEAQFQHFRKASFRASVASALCYFYRSFWPFFSFASYAFAGIRFTSSVGCALGPIGAYLYFVPMCPYCRN